MADDSLKRGAMAIARQIEGFLDFSAVISTPLDTAIASLTRRFGLTLHGYLSFENGGLTLVGFFRKHLFDYQDEVTVVQLSKAKDLGSTYRAEVPIRDADFVNFLRESREIPTMVIYNPCVHDGSLEMTLMFNHAVLDQVSEHITELSRAGSGASVSYLGRNSGIGESLVKISEELPLSYVEMHWDFPGSYRMTAEQKSLGKNWIRIMKYNLPGGSQKFLYSLEGKPSPKFPERVRPVERVNALYETEENDIILSELEKEVASAGVPRFLGVRVLRENHDMVAIVIVSSFVGEYIRCLNRLRERHKGFDTTLHQIQDVK